jgi:hypothetical protein
VGHPVGAVIAALVKPLAIVIEAHAVALIIVDHQALTSKRMRFFPS